MGLCGTSEETKKTIINILRDIHKNFRIIFLYLLLTSLPNTFQSVLRMYNKQDNELYYKLDLMWELVENLL